LLGFFSVQGRKTIASSFFIAETQEFLVDENLTSAIEIVTTDYVNKVLKRMEIMMSGIPFSCSFWLQRDIVYG